MAEQVDYYSINIKQRGDEQEYVVYAWGVYPSYSVLAGQPRKRYEASYDSLEEAQAAYPDASISSKWTEPQVSLNHLPDDGDY